MKLLELVPLHKDMRIKNLDRIRFGYTHGRVTFDVFFFIDGSPYRLLFGARGYNVAFEITVQKGFEINPTLSREDFKALCEALGLEYDPTRPFSMKGFFESFAAHIPAAVPANAQVRPADVARFHRDIEEASKVYFCGWRDNTVRGDQVSGTNLQKTKALLGHKPYEVCKAKNISSCWTDDEKRAISITPP